MSTTLPLQHVCCARLPATALAVLADLRRDPAIRVTPAGEHAWVHWEAGNVAVLRRLLPVPGVELFGRRDKLWYRPGDHLPSFGVAGQSEGEAIALARAVTPRPIEPIEPRSPAPRAQRLGLARSTTPRDATAQRCALADLARWADQAPTAQLTALEAAWAAPSDGGAALVMLRGQPLPTVAGNRFWGDRLLVPLGFQPEPDLPEPALRRALGVAEGAVVVLEAEAFEVIPLEAFGPLTRSGVRLAAAGVLSQGDLLS